MELDLENQYADRAYTILASLVVPRPIALVTTMSPEGHVNAAPFSFFNLMGANPPIVAIAPGDRSDGTPKDTAVNIGLTHEFVVNLVDEAIAEAMNECAAPLPYGASELERACLHTENSSVVKAPRLVEAPVSLECSDATSFDDWPEPGGDRDDQARPPTGRILRRGQETRAQRKSVHDRTNGSAGLVLPHTGSVRAGEAEEVK